VNAVWSFWTKPFVAERASSWYHELHHWLAWGLSVYSARQHYPQTRLVTDDEGARILIDELQLPFTHVSTALNGIARENPDWWALGKIEAYRRQEAAFVHIDTDVFLWKRLAIGLEQADIFAQNPEPIIPGASCYRPEELECAVWWPRRGWLPREWLWYRSSASLRAQCCGIFGGRRVDFIQHYADTAKRLVADRRNRALRIRQGKTGQMLLLEQYLLSACLEYHRVRKRSPFCGIEIRYLFENWEDVFRRERATEAGFTHLAAGAKSNLRVAGHLERRVREDLPGHYERCIKYVRDRGQRLNQSHTALRRAEPEVTSDHRRHRSPRSGTPEPEIPISAPNISVPFPLVTAVMITGKSQARNPLAREAVRCFVEQTYIPRELLILNEGKETIGVEAGNIREIRIEKVATRTLGDLRNLALELAHGDWLIQWDDDDWYGPERIEAQMRARRRGAAVLLGDIIHYSLRRHSGFKTDWASGFPGSILHERNGTLRYPSLSRGEDIVFQRQFRNMIVVRSERPLYIYRHHAQNTWNETHIMRSWTGQDNDVALNREEQQWLLWSLTPVALRHLLLEGENCDVIPSAAIQTVRASLGGLTFVVTVADKRPGQLALCLESIRTWHPDASLFVMSDSGTHSEYKAVTKRYLGRYVERDGLPSIAGDAHWWERICVEALREDGNCILKVDPSSRVCRPFCSAPLGDLFGAARSGASNGHVESACIGFSRKLAEKIVQSGVARRNCYLDPKTRLLGAEWEDFIRSCGAGHSHLDRTMMHMARSLGIKWQPWSEIGPHRGVQAVVNRQEFAITSRINSG